MRKQLKEKRIEKNLIHKEIDSKADISRAHYTNIELGNKAPSF